MLVAFTINKQKVLSKVPKTDVSQAVFGVISQNQKYVESFCNDMENPCRFACRKWFNQLN